jgi:serine/threonine protein kinase/Tol biopolymer transport system component
MPLTAGERLGPYEILALIGAGGMGEVYRARDTKLKRDVALKVLPEAFANDPERMARFQREAEVLASLNHANIAHIYGVEERALAMELVEGETLPCPLPVETALHYARQIAEALEYAHERGVVHRDLKPANIKITPEGVVKVLDFGLAKAIDDPVPSADPSNSPTLTLGATRVGVILGTAAYMSPEQASGKNADRRADIWSFGAVLYEMLAGKRAFAGESVSDTLATVLKLDPDWDALPAETPAAIRKLVRRCLTKDRKQRLQAIGEARIALENPGGTDSPAQAGSLPHSKLPWAVTVVVTLSLAVLAFVHFREKPPAAEVMRLQIPPPEKTAISAGPFLSPDGRRLAFETQVDGRRRLWVRNLDSLESRPLAGTEGLSGGPSWSPDSRYLTFAVQGKLKKIDASGGPPQTVCDLAGGGGPVARGRDGVIIFAKPEGLWQIAQTGCASSPLTQVDRSLSGGGHGEPAFLPDGRHFLYFRYAGKFGETTGVYLGSLDAKPQQQSSRLLAASDSGPIYAPSPEPGMGYVLFVREGSLMAQALDTRKLELAGEAVPIAGNFSPSSEPSFSVSATGVLAYWTGRTAAGIITRLTWFDREGKILGTVGDPGIYNSVSLSPDGTRLVVSRRETTGQNPDLWLYEFASGRSTRFTSDSAQDWLPVWSPDGSRIIFSSNRDGAYNLYQKASSGVSEEQVLVKPNESKNAVDWSALDWSGNGRFLLYLAWNLAASPDFRTGQLSVLPLDGERKPTPYLKTEGASYGRFSPDGRFVAYTSYESGRSEVFVQPFPDPSGGKWLVSRGGGLAPRWRRDGKELFYISLDSKMVAVEVGATPTFKAGVPKALFQAPIVGGGGTGIVSRYDVTGDGQKFLINAVPEEATSSSANITVVLNWRAGLKK